MIEDGKESDGMDGNILKGVTERSCRKVSYRCGGMREREDLRWVADGSGIDILEVQSRSLFSHRHF